jgi:hypothetical protein
LDDLRLLRILEVKEILEECTVMNKCLSKILSSGLSPRLSTRDVASNTIVRYHLWVIHRYVCRALIEITQRIPSSLHDLTDQSIGFHDSLLRSVDEATLKLTPRFCEPAGICCRKRPNVQAVDAFCPSLQRGFGPTHVSDFPDGAFVLRTEALPKTLTPLSFDHEPYTDTNQDRGDYDYPDEFGIHCMSPELFSRSCTARMWSTICAAQNSSEQNS